MTPAVCKHIFSRKVVLKWNKFEKWLHDFFFSSIVRPFCIILMEIILCAIFLLMPLLSPLPCIPQTNLVK